MDYTIRNIREAEYKILSDFLYERQYLFPKVSKHLQKILLINLNYRCIYQILESIVEITVLLQSLTKK